MKKEIGLATLLVSIVLLSIGIRGITGNVIVGYFQGRFLFGHLFGLILLFISILLLTSKKKL